MLFRSSKEIFDTWFHGISLGELNETEARVRVPNRFYRDWIRDHYQGLLEQILRDTTGQYNLRVGFVVSEAESPEKASPRESLDRPGVAGGTRGRRAGQINLRYSFENFVASPNNQLARAASMKVAESPAAAYNPLLIYGGVGLGKTHLMHAIGNYVLEHTDLRIAYVTSEQFTNEVINGIRYDKMIDEIGRASCRERV